jgi:RecA-family ATPase
MDDSMTPPENSIMAQAAAEYRAERDRRLAQSAPNVVPIRDDIEMDEIPLPPPQAYADEVTPRAKAAVITPGAERKSVFFPASDLDGKPVPPRQWLVDDLVPSKTVTLFGGDGGTGKSLLAMQLAVAVAAKTKWLGREVSHGRVIFITAEDDEDELHRRIDDIIRATGITYADLSDLTLRSLAGEDALLAVDSQVALIHSALFEELDARAGVDEPTLIVIDTLADVYPASENDRAKVRQFVGILRSLALKRECALILLAHPSLSGLNSGSGTSGSTAWNNSVRSRLYLSRIAPDGHEIDPDKRILATKKANYGRIGGEIAMTWRDGVFVEDGTPNSLERMAIGAKAERVFMKLLREYAQQGRHVSASPSVTFAPSVFAKHPKAEGMTDKALAQAMNILFDRGEIVIEEHGPLSRRRAYIAIAGAQKEPK